jgi:small basic protein
MFLVFARELEPITIARFAMAMALVELSCVYGRSEAMRRRRPETGRDPPAAPTALLGAGCLLVPLQLGLLWGLLAATGGVPDGLEAWLLAAVALRIPLDFIWHRQRAELARRRAHAAPGQRNLSANFGAAALALLALLLGQPLIGLAIFILGLSLFRALATMIGMAAMRLPHWDPPQTALLRPEATTALLPRGSATALHNVEQICADASPGLLAFADHNLVRRVEAAFAGVSESFARIVFRPCAAAAWNASEWPAAVRRAACVPKGSPAPAFVTGARAPAGPVGPGMLPCLGVSMRRFSA